MKIRVMGTEAECQAAREYYRGLEKESGVKSVSISGNYPNRGSNTIFRVYVEVEYYDAGESGRKELPSGRKKKMKSPGAKSKGNKKSAGNRRIKEASGNFWVLHKEHEIKKYRGFRNKAEAEQFAAATPVEKKVKITAEREKATTAKKTKKPEGARPRRKKYSSPEVKVVGLEAGKKETKVVKFSDGKKKYGK